MREVRLPLRLGGDLAPTGTRSARWAQQTAIVKAVRGVMLTDSRTSVDTAPYGITSPRQVPTQRALSTQGWSVGTYFSLPATFSSGTGSVPSPRAATMTP